MRKILILATALFVGLTRCLTAADPEAPSLVLKDLYAALKNEDLGSSKALIARSPKIPDEIFDEALADYAAGAKRSKLAYLPVPMAEIIQGDCGAVICKGNPIHGAEPRMVYFLRQEGEWRCLLLGTIWDHPGHGLSVEQRERFRKLEEAGAKKIEELRADSVPAGSTINGQQGGVERP